MANVPAKEIREVGDGEVVYTFEFFSNFQQAVVETHCQGLRTCLNAQQF